MAAAIIGVCGTLAGTLIGVFSTLLIQKRASRRRDAQVARVQIAELWGKIWADSAQWGDLKVELARLRVRLEILGVPDADCKAIEDVAFRCWHDSASSLDQTFGEMAGIEMSLNEEFDRSCAKVDKYLAKL